MQLLVQWLCSPESCASDTKSAILAHLQDPGISVAKTFHEEVCQCVKRFIGGRGERAEGLSLFDLVLDHIPDNVLAQDIVYFMKQLITLSANESFQPMCFTLLHRLILRLRTMTYIQRDMNTEVFPHLAQMLTRRLAVVPASASLLALTRATFSHFSKACLSNRDQFERFLFKQLIAAERHDLKSGLAVVQTLAALPRCYVDPAMRHDVATKHLDILMQSCLLTEQAFLVAGAGHCDPSQLQNTIYAIADEPLFPANSTTYTSGELRMILWKRLLLQLDAVDAALASSSAKDIQHKLVLALINQIVMCAHTDEHLLFLRPTLISRAVRIARQLVSGVRTHMMILVNARLTDFFLHVIDLVHQNDHVDMTMLRADVYDVVTAWIRNMTPASLMYRGKALQRILTMVSRDVAIGCDLDHIVTRGSEQRTASALGLQRAIVLAYGDRDSDIVRQALLKLIPATIQLTRPLAGALLTSALCRKRLYDLLTAFVINPNSGLMPPTAEIRDVVREGLLDDVYEVRELCDVHYRVLCNTLQPLECGFSLSYSHAMHEHNREVRRLQLTRSERTRSAEVQTDDGSLHPPVKVDKAVNASIALPVLDEDDDDDDDPDEEDELSDVEQIPVQSINRHKRPFPYAARGSQSNRPGPRSMKERRAVTALCDLEDGGGGEAIQLDESPSDDEEEMMEDDEIDEEQMEIDAQATSSFRTGRIQPEEQIASAGDAVIITDDDDGVAITMETPRSEREVRTAGVVGSEVEDEAREDLEEAEVDELEDEVEHEVEDDEEELAADEVCVIEDEDLENRGDSVGKGEVGSGQDRNEILPDETSRQSAITTPVKGNPSSGEDLEDVVIAANLRSDNEKEVLARTNGSDVEKLASPKLNGDSQAASMNEHTKSSDVEAAKKSSPEKNLESMHDKELTGTIVPIGPDDNDEDEAEEAGCTLAQPPESTEVKDPTSLTTKIGDLEIAEVSAPNTNSEETIAPATVIVPD